MNLNLVSIFILDAAVAFHKKVAFKFNKRVTLSRRLVFLLAMKVIVIFAILAGIGVVKGETGTYRCITLTLILEKFCRL